MQYAQYRESASGRTLRASLRCTRTFVSTAPSSATVLPPPDDARIGILYVLTSTFFFNGLNAAAKWLAADYSVIEITFFRNLFAFIPCLVWVLAGPGLLSLRTGRLGLHVFRGLAGACSMLLVFTSFSLLPIADAVAISFATPLFLTALSVPLLGEKVGVHRWSAVIVGFLGILVMARPSGTGAQLGFVTAVSSTLLNAVILVSVRRLGRTEAPLTIIFYQAFVGLLASTFLLPFAWKAPNLVDFGLFIAMGLVGVIGHFCLTNAFRYAAAAVVGPFNYTGIIWATAFGYVVWGDLPTIHTVMGGAIVIASGIYILYRETRKQVTVVGATSPDPGAG
jgi:drug/metabolite transporter (DMT)-like permease